jgi:hypothetical protein
MAGDKRPPVQHVLLSGRALPIVQAIHRVVQTSWSLKKTEFSRTQFTNVRLMEFRVNTSDNGVSLWMLTVMNTCPTMFRLEYFEQTLPTTRTPFCCTVYFTNHC